MTYDHSFVHSFHSLRTGTALILYNGSKFVTYCSRMTSISTHITRSALTSLLIVTSPPFLLLSPTPRALDWQNACSPDNLTHRVELNEMNAFISVRLGN
jgi:hypothetical protein